MHFSLKPAFVINFRSSLFIPLHSVHAGDVLSGVCFVGHLDTHSLGVFLLLPLCAYLGIGALFLLAGFVSLFRIRTVMKIDGKRTDKLERLMMRIGFFSALFVLPAVGFLACLFYEYYNFDEWMVQWNRDMCKMFSIPCPNRRPAGVEEARPLYWVFMAKYVFSMLVGVTSSVWLYSGKTVVSWRMFIERLHGGGAGGGGGIHVGVGMGGGGMGAGGAGVGMMNDRAALAASAALRGAGVGGNDAMPGGVGTRTRGTAYV